MQARATDVPASRCSSVVTECTFHARDRTSFTKVCFVIQIREIASRFGASTSCDAHKGLHPFKSVEKDFNLKKSCVVEHSY